MILVVNNENYTVDTTGDSPNFRIEPLFMATLVQFYVHPLWKSSTVEYENSD